MQHSRLSYRILLVIWACVLGFALGIEAPHAAALDESCLSICNDECEEHDGCDTPYPAGCDCFYVCEDGHEGWHICME